MLLTETESKVLRYLRNPFEMFQEKHSPINDLSNEDIVSLYNKMDAVIEDEGNMRRSLGNYDEIDTSKERYNFTWPGKTDAIRESQKQSTGTLRPCVEESKDWDSTQNLYIEGDNLEVLKLLQKSYYGKVKCIYIDPPYNTGKDFIYHDNYKDNLENYLELTGQVSKVEGEREREQWY